MAREASGPIISISPSLTRKNFTSAAAMVRVLGSPGVRTYSQLRHAKKNAPMIMFAMNVSLFVLADFSMTLSARGEIGSCRTTGGSFIPYARMRSFIFLVAFPSRP